MIAFVRMLMQLLFARLLAIGPIGELVELAVDTFGLTHEQIIDTATVVSLGLLVAASKALERSPLARVVEWWNLILSWGRSRGGPEYVGKHVRHGNHEPGMIDGTVVATSDGTDHSHDPNEVDHEHPLSERIADVGHEGPGDPNRPTG